MRKIMQSIFLDYPLLFLSCYHFICFYLLMVINSYLLFIQFGTRTIKHFKTKQITSQHQDPASLQMLILKSKEFERICNILCLRDNQQIPLIRSKMQKIIKYYQKELNKILSIFKINLYILNEPIITQYFTLFMSILNFKLIYILSNSCEIAQITNQQSIIIYIHLLKMNQQRILNARRNQNYNHLRANFNHLVEENYNVVNQIDRGSYGVVYKAQDKNTGGHCAIKINFNIISREQLYIQMGLLKLMRSKTRVPFLHKIIQNKGTYSIVMDYYKSKPFINYFHRFSMVEVKHYLYEILLGLKQLKGLGIYHRDLKPSNFLYDQSMKRGVIVDYGLAEVDPQFVKKQKQKVQELQENYSQQYQEQKQILDIYQNIQKCLNVVGRNKIGTEIFMPPQSVLRMQNQTYSSDIWPVGIIFLQFCSKRFNIFTNLTKLQQFFKLQKGYYVSFLLQLACLFGKQNVIDVCRDVFGYQLTLPSRLKQIELRSICIIQSFDDVAYDLLVKLLCLDPNKRITVQEVLQHQFFNEVRQIHT